MNFVWPDLLALLLLLPVLVVLYLWLLYRRKKNTLRYASLSLVPRCCCSRSRPC